MFDGSNPYQAQFIEKPMSSKPEKQEVAAECNECGQAIAPQCRTCGRFVYEPEPDAEYCEKCGQELREEEDDEATEEGQDIDDDPECQGYKWKAGKFKNEFIAKCRACGRVADCCPRCKQYWNNTDRETDEETDEEDSEQEETDSDESTRRKRRRGNSSQNNSSESTQESGNENEESGDENEDSAS